MLDRELKTPYVVPKEKMISDADVKKMGLLEKKVLKEIEVNEIFKE